MFCINCGAERKKEKYCTNCGFKFAEKHSNKAPLYVLFILVGFALTYALVLNGSSIMIANEESTETISQSPSNDDKYKWKSELNDFIAKAQRTVYTVFTEQSQGSGFLYSEDGIVVTNAHVVEGEIDVYVKTVTGKKLPGKVIGYSNQTDVAVIEVPALVGKTPYAIDMSEDIKIGEEVIALGSPLGLENTATIGYITGKNRNFMIDHYTYENLYQISAPIAPGSSGGPLISKDRKSIVAINSAEDLRRKSIGFSIPMYKVAHLIDQWINSPMSEKDILAQFYNVNGDLFFDYLWEYGEGYFDGGEYSDDYDDYWEYDFEN